MSIPQYPQIEKREITKKKKTEIRYFVVGVPQFNNGNGWGFKSEDALIRCWVWWWNNSFSKHKPARVASKEWKNGNRDDFYSNRSSDTKVAQQSNEDRNKEKIEASEFYDVIENDVPDWLN